MRRGLAKYGPLAADPGDWHMRIKESGRDILTPKLARRKCRLCGPPERIGGSRTERAAPSGEMRREELVAGCWGGVANLPGLKAGQAAARREHDPEIQARA